ncbi:MAG: hypothetical protein JSV64_03115 [Candidatus Bathyarchaeota archaeon]|nr:MAG: hypothetical protein JSV64_03115 [Candidatus Bathyarchaeota archaeon]
MTKLEITVMKVFTAKEVLGENTLEYVWEEWDPRSKHRVGEEFILDATNLSEGFCNWGFTDGFGNRAPYSRGSYLEQENHELRSPPALTEGYQQFSSWNELMNSHCKKENS